MDIDLREVRQFWLAQPPERWWDGSAEFDAEIRKRFLDTWEQQRTREADAFLGSPDDAVSAVILFDQIPRNMFRGKAESYATDHLALAVARGAFERSYDEGLSKEERIFVQMPFEHSENLDDQNRSLAMFITMGDPELIRFARLHHDIIERFGRFPHRNEILGRTPRAAEVAAGKVVPW